MNNTLLIIVTIIYGFTAFSHFMKGSPGFGIMFAGYTFANVGLMMAQSTYL